MGFDSLLEALTIQMLLIIYRKYCLQTCKLVFYLFPSIVVTLQKIHCLAIKKLTGSLLFASEITQYGVRYVHKPIRKIYNVFCARLRNSNWISTIFKKCYISSECYKPPCFYLQGQNASAYSEVCCTNFPNVYIHTDLLKYIKKKFNLFVYFCLHGICLQIPIKLWSYY